jgi:hypothetical protein
MKQDIMALGVYGRRGITFWQTGSRVGEKKGSGTRYPKDPLPGSYILWLGPTSQHFQNLPKRHHQLGTKHLILKPVWDISHSNHNITLSGASFKTKVQVSELLCHR